MLGQLSSPLLLLVCAFLSANAETLPPAASFFVPSIPDIHQDPDHPLTIHAGTLPSTREAFTAPVTTITPHLYFVMVKNRRTADRERLMFWFNGGPGCSSFDGLMMEVGPWRMDGKGGFKVQEGGWEEYTTMVYIDQPAGTGFSFTSTDKYDHSLQEASDHLVEFLRNFYKVFPELLRMDTYLGGESFAGQYIPYFANTILDTTDIRIPLKGIAIGNGWIDARRQYPAYLDYALEMGLIKKGTKEYDNAKSTVDKCMASLNSLPPPSSSSVEIINHNGICDEIIFDVTKPRERMENGKKMCANIYDVRYDDTVPDCGMNWPPDIHPITDFLQRTDVVRALHATENGKPWHECRVNIRNYLRDSNSNSSITQLPRVLERIPVLIFSGDQDLICNYIGLKNMVDVLTWSGQKGLGNAEPKNWTVNNAPAGTWVSARNMTFVKVYNASHMAPFDVPHTTHDMILRFMNVNFSGIVEGSAIRLPSALGKDAKTIFTEVPQDVVKEVENNPNVKDAGQPAKTPQQDTAKWEAYYNAGSAALILLVVFLLIGAFLWCRRRRKVAPGHSLPFHRDTNPEQDEESIPLRESMLNGGGVSTDTLPSAYKGKGKARADESGDDDRRLSGETLNPPIFDVGAESDDEDGTYEKYKDRPT